MKLHSFDKFLLEAETVKLDKDLREYVLTHVNDALFKLKSSDYYKEFSVTPYKKETLDSLKNAQSYLEKSIKDLNVEEMYDKVIKAELVPYTYGNVFTSKFSLKTVPDISMSLEPEQQRALASSEKEFLMNNFSSLNKPTKDNIIAELRERAEVLCAVIEALFYYIRTIDTDNFYKGMNTDEIVETYEEQIKKSSKEASFSFEGPFSDPATRSHLVEDSRTAFWTCEKDMKKFVIQATISTVELKTEENVSGTKGLKFSLLVGAEKMPEKDYNFFNVEELTARVKQLNDKILKKI